MGIANMQTSPLALIYDGVTQPAYDVRVRGTTPPLTYLWGSVGIAQDITFSRALILHIRNDPFGEPVTIGTQVAAGTQTIIGTLGPGECVSIPVQGISGIFGRCDLETTVGCLIKEAA
jgi:hypothetical protein